MKKNKPVRVKIPVHYYSEVTDETTLENLNLFEKNDGERYIRQVAGKTYLVEVLA